VAADCRKLKPARARLGYVAFELGSRLAPRVPRALAYRLADVVGDLFYLANREGRAAVTDNLRHVLGARPSWRLVREVFRHGARNYYDTLIIPSLTPEELLALVPVRDWRPLSEALAAGRGAIMVGVHLSGVALAGQVVAAKGFAITSVSERVEPPELNELLTRLRSGGGIRMLSLGPDVTRELTGALRRNEVVALVMDRDIAGTGVPVQFFDAETSLPGGAALLALRTGAPILSAVAVRTSGHQFIGQLDPGIEVERGDSLRESLRLTTRRIAERLEDHIRSHPEQWTVYQRLWPQESAAPSASG
jgi:KDO2-lipid IV(A) lauroyltransferase